MNSVLGVADTSTSASEQIMDPSGEPNRGADAPSEQRIAPRHRCSLAALTQINVVGNPRKLFAWIHNISASGVALDMRTPLEAGQEIQCRLKGLAAGEVFETRAHVVHVRLLDGLYRTGCKFLEPFPAAQLEAVLRKISSG
jgi:hypothetical protein